MDRCATKAILLVDDEPGILSSLRRELRDWSRERGIEIFTAGSAEEGLEILGREGRDIGVIVSDLRLPGIQGSEFLSQARAANPSAIAFLMTAYMDPEGLAKSVKAGIFGLLPKPFDSDYLRQELDKALELRKLREDSRERAETAAEELEWAGQMQSSLLRLCLKGSSALDFDLRYLPMSGYACSGDYYDVIDLGKDRFVLLLGDVSGHGVKAAFLTGILKAVIYPEFVSSAGPEGFGPAEFLSWLNRRLDTDLRRFSGMIITMFAALLDARTGSLLYANAGQNHPFVVSKGKARELEASGPGIGFLSEVSYRQERIDLEPDDLLFAYTDGIVETGTNDSSVGSARLASILGSCAGEADCVDRAVQGMLAASGADKFGDDVTILAARFRRHAPTA